MRAMSDEITVAPPEPSTAPAILSLEALNPAPSGSNNPFDGPEQLPSSPRTFSATNPFAEGLLTEVPRPDPETELERLRAERADLAATLAEYKSLVQRMNDQYKSAMEKADEEGFALERSISQVQHISTTAETLKEENGRVIKELVEAKISLAETKGEYMQLLKRLQQALAKETDYRAKLDELEELVAMIEMPDEAGAEASRAVKRSTTRTSSVKLTRSLSKPVKSAPVNVKFDEEEENDAVVQSDVVPTEV